MSNKIVVVYTSKSGFTEKYAKWIAEELGADIFSAKKVNVSKLMTYDTIIYGGSIFASNIVGSKLITNNMEQFVNKKLILFAVGATSMNESEKIKTLWDSKVTKEQQQSIKFFYFIGGMDVKKLPFGYKILISIMKKMLSGKKNPTEEEKNMLKLFSDSFDYSKKEYIMPLIQSLK